MAATTCLGFDLCIGLGDRSVFSRAAFSGCDKSGHLEGGCAASGRITGHTKKGQAWSAVTPALYVWPTSRPEPANLTCPEPERVTQVLFRPRQPRNNGSKFIE